MNNIPKCKQLFSFNSVLFEKIFFEFERPWEILSHLSNIISSVIESGINGYKPLSNGILVGEGVEISDSASIEAPAIIGKGCKIRHGAFLRGAVLLGDGCVVGNSSEIKNSVLMHRAQAPHFNYVGDSILGSGAHLGAGAICSNLRSDKANVMIRATDITLDTGMKKLGAILGDNVEIGCGAVLCPGTVIGKNSTVYPLTLVRGVYAENCIVKNDGSVIPSKENAQNDKNI